MNQPVNLVGVVLLAFAVSPAWTQAPPAPASPAKVTLLAPVTIKVKSGMAVLKGPAAGELSWDWDERFLSDTDDKRQVYVNKAARELVAVAPSGTYRFSCTAFEAAKGAIKQVYYVEFEGGPVPPGPLPPVPPVPPVDPLLNALRIAWEADKKAGKGTEQQLKSFAVELGQADYLFNLVNTTGLLRAALDALVKMRYGGDLPNVSKVALGHVTAVLPIEDKPLDDDLKKACLAAFARLKQAIESLLGPQPPPGPDPPPGPSPIPEPGLHVLIVYESGPGGVTPAQNLVISGAEVRGYVRSKGGQFRYYDQNTPLANEAKWVQEAMKRDRKSLPWIIVSNHPKGGFEGPMPATVQEAVALLKKWGDLP